MQLTVKKITKIKQRIVKILRDICITILEVKQQKIVQVYNTAIVDLLATETNKSEAISIAYDFSKNIQSIIGVPATYERVDISKLLNKEIKVKKEEQNRVAQIKIQEQSIQRDIEKIREKIDNKEDVLIQKGTEKEKEDNSNIVKKTWHWLVGTFGTLGAIAAIVALAIFVPGSLPILGQIFSYLISKVPSLINFFGVVGKSVMTNVVTGIQGFKDEIANLDTNKDGKISKQEAIDIASDLLVSVASKSTIAVL